MTPCASCLRRTALIGLLSPHIGGKLGERRRAGQLLAMPDERLIEAVGGSKKSEARALVSDFDPEARLDEMARAGLDGVCRHDPLYPRQLTELGDPPALLHSTAARAALAELYSRPVAAIVGTRRASAYGLEVATAIGRGLAAAGVTVVSGLALGIDAAAHRGALDGGGPTLAVLGCGADRPYPRAHRSLYDRIRACGSVVSELPPGAAPARWTFPARNRIMAALAQVTVVVEAAERSGSLITAGFAEDLGRDVCAVPGRVTARMAAGANRLLVDGAQVIRGPDDVLDLIFGAGGWEAPRSDAAALESELDPGLRRVLAAVEAGDVLDEAGGEPTLPPSELRAALGRLELLGLVRRDGLGAYVRVAAGRGPPKLVGGLA
ncbi:MAG: processing protein [Thermoleophilaceae bacterium]|nr:processing protein [Thermoleophilaceae bacterium]